MDYHINQKIRIKNDNRDWEIKAIFYRMVYVTYSDGFKEISKFVFKSDIRG